MMWSRWAGRSKTKRHCISCSSELAERNVSVELVQGDQAAERGVVFLYRFAGPKGLFIELFLEPLIDRTPLKISQQWF